MATILDFVRLKIKPPHMLPQINIAHPCHQDWHKMNREQNGRFCLECEKTVIDFTKMSDEDLVKYLTKSGSICGRFNDEQVENENVPTEVINHRSSRLKLFSIITFFVAKLLSSHSAKAQDSAMTTLVNADQEKANQLKKIYTDSTIFHVTGKVMAWKKSKPLDYAKVTVKVGNNFVESVRTDSNGYFELNIPCKNGGDKIDIVIKKSRFKIIRIENFVPDSNEPLEIYMRRDKNYVEYRMMGCPSF